MLDRINSGGGNGFGGGGDPLAPLFELLRDILASVRSTANLSPQIEVFKAINAALERQDAVNAALERRLRALEAQRGAAQPTALTERAP